MAVEWRFYLPPNNYYLLNLFIYWDHLATVLCFHGSRFRCHVISLFLVYLHISLNILKILCAVVLDYKKLKNIYIKYILVMMIHFQCCVILFSCH